ncbi:Fe-S-cluster oxidoreductase [Chitinibacter tainanensis]|uniref:Fe-S-cluster oxidoreductase n=1 Tax=Chitinibacter tainanensis TaxID=230667 RepID=UPI00235596BA|nr:Fe-S-cluster oxidoreductase [Chitinibacter tainanensis]
MQLYNTLRCRIFGHPDRPAVCAGLQPQLDMCGQDRAQAMLWLTQLEQATRPH